MNNQIVIIINGQGGVGKDLFVSICKNFFEAKNISSIDIIKDYAKTMGWQGEKTEKARKFLSDLKNALIAYNNCPFNNMINEIMLFNCRFYENNNILFIHIREAEEIRKVVDYCNSVGIVNTTLLIKGEDSFFGNPADDDVFKYKYEFTFENYKDKEMSPNKVLDFMNKLLNQKGVKLI